MSQADITGQSLLTIIAVSDFEASSTKTWKDEILMARALAKQDFDRPFKTVMVENEAHRGQTPPPELFENLPELEILYAPSDVSAALKDFAIGQCETPWVAVLEADAAPEPDWLTQLFESIDNNGAFAAYSGRTYYGAGTSWRRVLNLLDRSFDDKGASGETMHISNNGAIYRTDVLKQFPYPPAGTPFLSSRKRNNAMREAGHRVYFNRRALMQHAIGGLGFVVDFRRNTGFSDMMNCSRRSALRAPALIARRMGAEINGAIRVGPQYLRWYDWPLWAVMLLLVRIPELMGIASALRGAKKLERTDYR